jgi:hypothetical protein
MRGRNASRVGRSPNFIFVLFVPFVVFFLVFNTTKYLYGEEFEPRKTRKKVEASRAT